MNDDAHLYAKTNKYQKDAAKKALDKFAPLLQWREDGGDGDSVLDIGCGNGDVTIELILPLLPPECRHLLASDMSDEMIKYANHHHSRVLHL